MDFKRLLPPPQRFMLAMCSLSGSEYYPSDGSGQNLVYQLTKADTQGMFQATPPFKLHTADKSFII